MGASSKDQGYSKIISNVFLGRLKGVLRGFNEVLFGSLMSISWVFQRCFKKIQSVFQGCFKKISMEIKEC